MHVIGVRTQISIPLNRYSLFPRGHKCVAMMIMRHQRKEVLSEVFSTLRTTSLSHASM